MMEPPPRFEPMHAYGHALLSRRITQLRRGWHRSRTENERTLGFFVKHVDGGEDANPNLQLFKTRIYQPVQYLDVPQEVQSLQRYIWH